MIKYTNKNKRRKNITSKISSFPIINNKLKISLIKELKKDQQILSKTFKALSHPFTHAILEFFKNNNNTPTIVTDIYTKLKLEQSVVSQRLAIMLRLDIINKDTVGTFHYYKVNYKKLNQLLKIMKDTAKYVRT